jgi:hypothetical protein
MNVDQTNNAGLTSTNQPTPVGAPHGVRSTVGIESFGAAHLPTQRVPRSFDNLSEDGMREIVRLVTPNDRLRMAVMLRHPDRAPNLNTALTQSVPSARRASDAAGASNRADFQRILAATASAATAAPNTDDTYGQAETISALARRVLVLPLREQVGAFEALREGLDGPAGRGHRIDLIAMRDRVVNALTAILPHPNEIAGSGINIAQLVAFLEIDDDELINQLQLDAVGPSQQPGSAWAAANTGRRVSEIATEFGITFRGAIRELQQAVVRSDHPDSARVAVNSGEPVAQVAARFDITIHALIYQLERLQINSTEAGSAGVQARNGSANVQTLISAHGITTTNGVIALQLAAAGSTAPGSAGALARIGGNVAAIATQFGILHHRAVYQLEKQQIESDSHHSAGFAARAGARVTDLVEQHGFVTDMGIYSLQVEAFRYAAMPAVTNGEDVEAVIDRCGIVDARLIDLLRAAADAHQAAL